MAVASIASVPTVRISLDLYIAIYITKHNISIKVEGAKHPLFLGLKGDSLAAQAKPILFFGGLPLRVLVGVPILPRILISIEYDIFFAATATLLVLLVALKPFPALIGFGNVFVELTGVDIFRYLFSFCHSFMTLLHTTSVHDFPGRRLPLICVIVLQRFSHTLNYQPRLLGLVANFSLATLGVFWLGTPWLRLSLSSIIDGVYDLRWMGVGLGTGRTDGVYYFGVRTNWRRGLGSDPIKNSMPPLNFAAFLYLAAVRFLRLKSWAVITSHHGTINLSLFFGDAIWGDAGHMGHFDHLLRFLFLRLVLELYF